MSFGECPDGPRRSRSKWTDDGIKVRTKASYLLSSASRDKQEIFVLLTNRLLRSRICSHQRSP